MDLSGDNLIYVIGGLAFLVIAGIGIALTGESGGEQAVKRAKQLGVAGSGHKRALGADKNDVNNARRKQTERMLNKLR